MQLSYDLRKQLTNPSLSDVTIVVDNGQHIAAHKVVIAARLPVFAGMIGHGMRENVDNKVAIDDTTSTER